MKNLIVFILLVILAFLIFIFNFFSSKPKLDVLSLNSSISSSIFYNEVSITFKQEDRITRATVCLPAFQMVPPPFYNQRDLSIFKLQPENHRWENPYYAQPICGDVLFIKNSTYEAWNISANESHTISKCTYPAASKLEHKNLFAIREYCGHVFQHFIDNIGPQIGLLSFLINFSEVELFYEKDRSSETVTQLWQEIQFKSYINNVEFSSAENLIVVETGPRIHPILMKKFLSLLKTKPEQPKTVFYFPRQGFGVNNGRFIENEDKLIETIKAFFGPENVKLLEKQATKDVNEARNLLKDAKLIIGMHGGSLYNMIYVPKDCVIVEILPAIRGGLLPKQSRFNEFPIVCHLSFWALSSTIGLQYRRYYIHSERSDYHIVDLNDFKLFLNWTIQNTTLKYIN